MTYKLIKKYPGSVKVGTTVCYNNDGYYSEIGSGNRIIGRSIVEDYPDFWEKVPEKHYEILSFIRTPSSNYTGGIFTLCDNGYYTDSFNNNLSLEYCLICGGFDIHSVKRLSDGQIFTVGDLVVGDLSGKITRFELSDLSSSGITVYSDNMLIPGYNNCCLSYIKHSEIIFITEDGVKIAKGDTVDVYSYVKSNATKITKFTKPNVDKHSFSDNLYYFSNIHSAKKHFIHSSKCLSIDDVVNIFSISGNELNKLIKLVNNRMNIVVNE